MLNRLKGIFQFDQLIWDSYIQDGYHVVEVHLKVGDGYAAKAISRRRMHALAYALRNIAEQMLAER